MLCGEVFGKHIPQLGQPWIIDTMLCSEVLMKHPNI